MKMDDVRKIAKKKGVKAGKLGKTELIRTIQKAEGNYDCHATSYVQECNQSNCLWRTDCMDAIQSAARSQGAYADQEIEEMHVKYGEHC